MGCFVERSEWGREGIHRENKAQESEWFWREKRLHTTLLCVHGLKEWGALIASRKKRGKRCDSASGEAVEHKSGRCMHR